MRALPLPATPGEATPAWLTAVLRVSGLLQRASVTKASWERIGEEQGFTGALARFHLEYDRLAAGQRGASHSAGLAGRLPGSLRGGPDAPGVWLAGGRGTPRSRGWPAGVLSCHAGRAWCL